MGNQSEFKNKKLGNLGPGETDALWEATGGEAGRSADTGVCAQTGVTALPVRVESQQCTFMNVLPKSASEEGAGRLTASFTCSRVGIVVPNGLFWTSRLYHGSLLTFRAAPCGASKAAFPGHLLAGVSPPYPACLRCVCRSVKCKTQFWGSSLLMGKIVTVHTHVRVFCVSGR